MDECVFQQQLHDLNQQMANMAARFPPRHLATSSSLEHTFQDQLQDIKSHLARMEERLSAISAAYAVPGDSENYVQPSTVGQDARNSLSWERDLGQHHEWHICSQLCCISASDRLGSLECHLSSLEGHVSSLEDEIDNMDPERFTPPSSVASAEDAPPTVASHPESVEARLALPTLQSSAGGLPKAEIAAVTIDMLKAYNSIMQKQLIALDMDNASIVRDILALHTGLLAERDPLPKATHGAFSLQGFSPLPSVEADCTTVSELQASCLKGGTRPEVTVEAITSQDASKDSAAFLNREIARLEEMLRDAQASLRTSEQHIADREQRITNLETELHRCRIMLDDMAGSTQARDEKLADAEARLTNGVVIVDHLEQKLRSKDEDVGRWEEVYIQMQQSHNKESMARAAAEDEIRRLRKILHDRDREIDHLVSSSNEEIRRLQYFCEQKDAITQEQEQIIARGARLLEQRDDEIEVLDRKLKAAQDDKQHEARQHDRLARLLEERDRELAELVAETAKRAPAIRSFSDLSSNENATKGSPWTPKPLENDSRLPHEAQRAAVWEGEQDSRPVFGRPSPIAPRRHEPRLRGGDRGGDHGQASRRGRYIPHRRVLGPSGDITSQDRQRDALDETSKDDQPQSDTAIQTQRTESADDRRPEQPSRPSNRHRLPLDHTFLPPLPAPVAAHKMRSLADLRSTHRGEPHRSLAKHQSLQELPRRNLHAYVETEAESAAELGGEV